MEENPSFYEQDTSKTFFILNRMYNEVYITKVNTSGNTRHMILDCYSSHIL